MGSLRVGNALNALSNGIGLFAEREAGKEADRISREWDLTLQSMRERANKEDRDARFAHDITQRKEADKTAQGRLDAQLAANQAAAETLAGAREKELAQARVDRAREKLQDTMLELEKQQLKEIEALPFGDDAAKMTIMGRYRELKDDAIIGHVAWLNKNNLPGYEVKDEDGLKSILMQAGMDPVGAADIGPKLWAQIGPPIVSRKAVARGETALSDGRFLSDPDLLESPIGLYDETATSAAAPSTGSPAIKPPRVQQPWVSPQGAVQIPALESLKETFQGSGKPATAGVDKPYGTNLF